MLKPAVPGQRRESDGRRRPRLSPITRRILAVNVFALAVLVVGLLYVGRYRQELIQSEFHALTIQAEMFAAALGEAAVGAENSLDQSLVPDMAGQIVRRLARTTRTQAVLVGTKGEVLTDSRRFVGPGGTVDIEELPPPAGQRSFAQKLLDFYDNTMEELPSPSALDELDEALPVSDRRETRHALAGDTSQALRRGFGRRMLLSAAVPVQRYKQVLGAIVLTRDSRAIDAAMLQVRLDILKVFGIALFITVLLSIYLAGTIARPLRRLALAADRVRRGLSRQYAIPELGGRNDEIRELSGALREMTEALWKRMDAIEGFAADVAHEIKNPLTSLRSAIETAARITDPGQRDKLMAIVIDDIQRLDRLISDISNASRLDAELSRAEMVPIDLSAIADTMIALHEAAEDAHGVRLMRQQIEGQSVMVVGDEDRIVQVLRNLIDNAISFSPEGGTIALRVAREGGTAVVSVEDEGPGIPAGSEESIFERFYCERPAGEKFGTHSGLGLSISRQIVEAHRGTIKAQNRTGPDGKVLGARFIVRLPAAA